ncbi:MAG: hypothetical protein L6Q29_03505 [Candidatus Pacebacteria bacterium]|nr:hypothetical protein [Candidatus Paceibacterota bacterium]NUQ57523.1 hypothetical protein [Candidatus Paceibacter sp.]
MIIKIKPLSVNRAWQGKRYKTQDYEDYETELLLKLPKLKMGNGKLELYFKFGFSNKGQDIDSSLKPTIDILQKKWGINDKNIYRLIVDKEITKRGEEFIEISLWEI